jgi:hypothetical protein
LRCHLGALRSQSVRNSLSSAAARRVIGRAPIERCRPELRPHGVFVPGLIDA